MESVEQLVELANQGISANPAAVQQLVALGVSAMPAILDTIRANARPSIVPFDSIILQIHDREMVPILARLVHEQNPNLVIVAFEALAKSQDRRALPILLNCLIDTDEFETRRALAAQALGDLGYSGAIESLLKVTNEARDEEMFKLALAAVSALAKLGNHETAHVAVSLADYQEPDADPAYDDSEIIRLAAVTALQHVVAPGMLATLQKSLQASSSEIRHSAVDALFYLGTKSCISQLAMPNEDDDLYILNHKHFRFRDLTGCPLDEDAPMDVQVWWQDNQHLFEEQICYRQGKPLWIHTLIDLLDQGHNSVMIFDELYIITGVNFPVSFKNVRDQDELIMHVKHWWKQNNHRFEPGSLYKYGYKQDISIISA